MSQPAGQVQPVARGPVLAFASDAGHIDAMADRSSPAVPSEGTDAPRRVPRAAIVLAGGVILVVCAVEIVLTLADFGLFGPQPWRRLALSYGAFWNGLLGDWRTNYPGQPVAMFLSYALLHADLSHLAGNVLVIGYLVPALARRVGTGVVAAVLAAAVPGGAAVFTLLSDSVQPMVGASGAVFGLIGAWLQLDLAEARARAEPVRPVLSMVLWLAALNFVMWWILDGALAWETHAGGFLAGWAVCALLTRRPARG